MSSISNYRGRFAPSPTGPLHFGSLVAAVGSYLDARKHHGNWLVRMEDLDTPRCTPAAAKEILRTLTAFGLQSDEPVLYQSQRSTAYQSALHRLQKSYAAYPCCCTRKEVADSALHGIEGLVYPGTCRNGIPAERKARAWRIRTDLLSYPHSRPGIIAFDDLLQGHIKQNLAQEIGDFVVKRADGLFAYQLAVVVDDAYQGITHVVRGADLLTSTARQIYLQQLLELPVPGYLHLPVAINRAGEKLSKQTLAAAVDTSQMVATLVRVLDFLQQNPPAELIKQDVAGVLDWGIRNWDVSRLRNIMALPAPDTASKQ